MADESAYTAPIKRACDKCRRRKVKCIAKSMDSCRICASDGLACTFNDILQKKGRKRIRASVLLESCEAQRNAQLATGFSITSGSDSQSLSKFAQISGIMPPALVKSCIEYSSTHMYPSETVLHRGKAQGPANDMDHRSNLSIVQGTDTLDDMEMDDINFDNLDLIGEQPSMQQFSVQNQYSQCQNQQTQLSVDANLANNMHNNQGMHTSITTTTSPSQQFNPQNTSAVSSVNTLIMCTMPMQNHNLTWPESTQPGGPAELGMIFGGFDLMMGMDIGLDFGNGNGNFGMGAFKNHGTIDQPGNRLFSEQGGGLNQAQLQTALKSYQLIGNDQSEMVRRLQEQQLINGAGITQFPCPEEVKPFRCLVIGCEKSYKKQNGLQYHRQHGHRNQQLKENDDGTFSILDPLTSTPYPGTVGMEKEKPYRCEVCGKRYKNFNSLKYHLSHTPHYNLELAMQKFGLAYNLQNFQNANVAGAGMGDVDLSMF